MDSGKFKHFVTITQVPKDEEPMCESSYKNEATIKCGRIMYYSRFNRLVLHVCEYDKDIAFHTNSGMEDILIPAPRKNVIILDLDKMSEDYDMVIDVNYIYSPENR